MKEQDMAQNPPEGYPRITPYLLYEDVAAALDWLAATFGFVESVRMPGPDGRIAHAEMKLADGVVMMGHPGADYQNPRHTGQRHQLLYVYVDDVDGHHERAVQAGATIVSTPEDKFYGDRAYLAEDPEGHHWNFAQHMRDPSPEEMKAAMAAMATT
jgi:PhnB protein